MIRISNSSRYLLALVVVLLSIPLLGGMLIKRQIKKGNYSIEETTSPMLVKIEVPHHKTLSVDSYEKNLTFYAIWSNRPDTLLASNYNDILYNPNYFSHKQKGDTFSIQFLSILKAYVKQNNIVVSTFPKYGFDNTATVHYLGKAPENMVIKGGDIQVIPIESMDPVLYTILEGSLTLGLYSLTGNEFSELSKLYPTLPIGNNYQYDFDNLITSPATIYVAPHALLNIKEGYNVAQTTMHTKPAAQIYIEHETAHENINWNLADSTIISCTSEQQIWFSKQFPNVKKIIFKNVE